MFICLNVVNCLLPAILLRHRTMFICLNIVSLSLFTLIKIVPKDEGFSKLR